MVTLQVVTFEGRPHPHDIALDGGYYYLPHLASPPPNQPGARSYPRAGAGLYKGVATKHGAKVTLRIGSESFELDGPMGCM